MHWQGVSLACKQGDRHTLVCGHRGWCGVFFQQLEQPRQMHSTACGLGVGHRPPGNGLRHGAGCGTLRAFAR